MFFSFKDYGKRKNTGKKVANGKKKVEFRCVDTCHDTVFIMA